MKLGILGLPGSGKSTLFDLMTECFDAPGHAAAHGRTRSRTVKVKDPRLERLRDDFQPRKYTPAALEILDFPGVEAGAENRSGLADLLAPARELEALILVLRDFASPGMPPPDPQRELAEVKGEFILADLVVVERRLERLEEKSRKRNYTDDDRKEREILERVRAALEEETPVAAAGLEDAQKRRLTGFGFLSAKPYVLAVNRGEGSSGTPPEALREASGAEVIAVNAKDELEILQLPADEQEVFLAEYGITALSRDPLIAASYRAAGCISFFTVGDKEVRAWTIRRGEVAVEAAGAIHTDMARGFIRAEVVSYEDYLACGGSKAARERGQLRLEGKEYVVQDGDIVEFRFSV